MTRQLGTVHHADTFSLNLFIGAHRTVQAVAVRSLPFHKSIIQVFAGIKEAISTCSKSGIGLRL